MTGGLLSEKQPTLKGSTSFQCLIKPITDRLAKAFREE